VPFVNGTISVHRIPSRVRDDRDTPLEWDETAIVLEVIWVRREAEYFYKSDWTGEISLKLQENFALARIGKRRSPDGANAQLSSHGLTGRPSIPEALMIQPRSRGVLDHPPSRVMTTLIPRPQPVPDPGFGQDELRAFRIGFDLLPELPHIDP